ncbi:MAG: peptidase dimerization domain-containing protein, partial [Candidatus Adiutrix sp.]|nr:peptidase dimerization domain-containing protein [Candidatus Adiutrix sp.]
GAPGHGCGHNLLAEGTLLAACAAKEALTAAGLEGVIRYYGCPGEEQLTGKGRMAELGYFDGADVALAWHPADFSHVSGGAMTAVYSAKFRFKGKSAHAGASPEAGRSALDAVELMNVGSNYLREHMLDQDRLHYVITNGGQAPNIVPQEAEVWYFARAPHDGELAALWARLIKVAKGAAMMTETEVEILPLGGCYNTLPNKALNRVMEANLLNFSGGPGFDENDQALARELQATLPPAQIEAALNKPAPIGADDRALAARPLPCFDEGRFIMGSSDVGDVANIMPTAILWGVAWPVGVTFHSWQAVASAGSPIGLKGAGLAAKTLAGTLFDLVSEPGLIEKAKQEFAERRQGRPYRPIGELLA